MKCKLIPIILLASLSFNLFFAIGVYKRGTETKAPEKTSQEKTLEFAAKLGMDEQQTKDFLALVEKSRAARESRKGTIRKQYDLFWAEIVKDTPDEKVLEQFIVATSSRERKERFVEGMRSLMSILRPDQRTRAVEMIRSHYRESRKKRSTLSK